MTKANPFGGSTAMVPAELVPVNGWLFDVHTLGQAGGPLVLLLHGFPQSAFAWRSQMAALSRAGYRAMAPNQRGYSPGARPQQRDDYAVDKLIADAVGLVNFVRRRCHLVGHDWGGALAWLIAALHPDRVASLTVLSRPHPTAFGRALKEAADQKHRSRHHRAFQRADVEDQLLADNARHLRQRLRDEGVPADAAAQYLAVLGTREALGAAINWYRAAGGRLAELLRDAPATLDRISVPTCYIWGSDDSTVGPQAAQWTADYVAADYRFETLADRGHFLTDEAPDAVNEILLSHLQSYPIAVN